jgi:hypothetical protein
MAGGSSNTLRAVLKELGWSRTRLVPSCADRPPAAARACPAHSGQNNGGRTIQPALRAGRAFACIQKPTCGYAATCTPKASVDAEKSRSATSSQHAARVATPIGWCGLDTAPSPLRVMPSHSRPIYKPQPRTRRSGRPLDGRRRSSLAGDAGSPKAGPESQPRTSRSGRQAAPTTPAGRRRTTGREPAGRNGGSRWQPSNRMSCWSWPMTSAGSTLAPTTAASGRSDAQHRPDRLRGRPVDRQLRPGQLHGRAGGVHHRADPDAGPG